VKFAHPLMLRAIAAAKEERTTRSNASKIADAFDVISVPSATDF